MLLYRPTLLLRPDSFQKQLPPSATPDKAAVNRYFFENHTTTDQAEAAWNSVPSPLEAMYKDMYSTREPGATSEPDGANDCVNYGTEYGGGGGTQRGSIRSVSGLSNATSAAVRRMTLAMESRPSPAELSEVEVSARAGGRGGVESNGAQPGSFDCLLWPKTKAAQQAAFQEWAWEREL